MPIQKRKPRSFKKSRVMKGKRSAIKTRATNDLIVYMAPRLMPFPPRYRCKFTSAIYGYIPAASTAGIFQCGLNYAYLPFAGGTWTNAVPAIATLAPTGYSSLLNANLYKTVRVYASKIKIEFLPQALTDTMEVTVTPSGLTGTPTTTAVAMAQPYTKSGFMSSSKQNSNSRGGSALVNEMTQHKLLGVGRRAIEDDLSGNYEHVLNALPSKPMYWVVNWTTPDAQVTTQPCEYRVVLTHYVECYNATNAQFLET